MARPLRIQFPDAWYHVMNRGKRGENLFTDKEDYYAFIELLKDCVDMWNVRVVADANLSRCMRHIDGVYTQLFNRSHGFYRLGEKHLLLAEKAR
jgi:putative transposase